MAPIFHGETFNRGFAVVLTVPWVGRLTVRQRFRNERLYNKVFNLVRRTCWRLPDWFPLTIACYCAYNHRVGYAYGRRYAVWFKT